MKNKALTTLFAIALISIIDLQPLAAKSKQKTINPQVQEVVKHLVGIMDTTAQAQTNPKYPSVRMTTCKITITDNPEKSAVYLYQEQYLTHKLSQPYRQRFLKISPSKNYTIESAGFKPLEPTKLINICNQPAPVRKFTLADLGQKQCSVFLRKQGKNYIGETPKEGCPSNYKGAVKTTNKIILHSTGMDTFDRGYDAQGKLLWGADNQGKRILN